MLSSNRLIFTILIVFISLSARSFSLAQYQGRGSGHAWRAEAATRINQHRKADLNVTAKLSDGSVLSDANIEISMQRHQFKFGSAVDARYMLDSQALYNSQYAEKIKDLFNAAVYENHMKWRPWAGNWGSAFDQSVTQEGLTWLNENDIDVRGHAMLWTRRQSVANHVQELLDITNPTQQDLQDLYDASFAHINDIGSAVKGKVFAWDMLNEARTSHDIEDKLIGFTPAGGAEITNRTDLRHQWFQAANAVDPEAKLFLNDFSILPGGDFSSTNARTSHRAILDDLIAAGTPVEGIGFQSHFKQPDDPNDPSDPNYTKQLTGIPKLIEMLDAFEADYNLPVHITEYDYDIDTSVDSNRFLQKDYTRDFLTAMFSHESVEAFLFWGFWEGKMSNPNAALFDLNFDPTLNGNQYLDLVFNQWWTEEMGLTDALGTFGTRGFKGDYLIKVDYDGKTYEFDVVLGDGGLDFDAVIGVPEPSGILLTAILVSCPWGWRRRRG